MSSTQIAAKSGTFDLGGETTVRRLGCGAMHCEAAAIELTDEQVARLDQTVAA